MIFTECPYCDSPQCFAWDGQGHGWFPSRCGKCNQVMWVEATRLGGMTRDSADFRANIMRPGDEAEIDKAELEATDQNAIEDSPQ